MPRFARNDRKERASVSRKGAKIAKIQRLCFPDLLRGLGVLARAGFAGDATEVDAPRISLTAAVECLLRPGRVVRPAQGLFAKHHRLLSVRMNSSPFEAASDAFVGSSTEFVASSSN